MRRTPSFAKLDYDPFKDGDTLDVLKRPDAVVGDYLENQRILRALHDKLHFPELEDIIDNKESLDSFYVFSGTRFIRDRVSKLFDDSEYSFPNMLTCYFDTFFKKLNFPHNKIVGEMPWRKHMKIVDDYLSKYKDFSEFKAISNLSDLVFSEVKRTDEKSLLSVFGGNGLEDYASDYSFSIVNTGIYDRILKGFGSMYGYWIWYSGISDPAKAIRNSVWYMYKVIRNRRRFTKLITSISEELSTAPGRRSYIGIYVTRLSACMNLPDDKYAELYESELVDKWLELFDNFYPQYEKLKAWYVQEKEFASSGT